MANAAPSAQQESVLSIYLDETDPDNIAIYLVRELIKANGRYARAGAVQARAHAGWRVDPGTWLERSVAKGDIGDECLATAQEVAHPLAQMGLSLDDGTTMLVNYVAEVTGQTPEFLPVDPEFEARRTAAREMLNPRPEP